MAYLGECMLYGDAIQPDAYDPRKQSVFNIINAHFGRFTGNIGTGHTFAEAGNSRVGRDLHYDGIGMVPIRQAMAE